MHNDSGMNVRRLDRPSDTEELIFFYKVTALLLVC